MRKPHLCLIAAAAMAAVSVTGCSPESSVAAPGKTDASENPAAAFDKDGWTKNIAWEREVNIEDFQGETADEKFRAAQKSLGEKGGVIRFPAGTFRFQDDILLNSGVVIRGVSPVNITDARENGYTLQTRLLFPRFKRSLKGKGTPHDSAFKGIRLAEPATAANCGVVNVWIDHGSIRLGQGADRKAGKNRLVIGCLLTNAAAITSTVPDAKIGQHPWQRYTAGHDAAIDVYTGRNALVANNRLAPSNASYYMKDYILRGRGSMPGKVSRTVKFDYDNRPGISVNAYALGGGGTRDPKGTPETVPHGFRKGIVIVNNYVYSTGRTCIEFTGDGTICSFNVVRMAADVPRHTNTGRGLAAGSSTNDNRPMTVRGWRYTIEGNDLLSYRNRAGFGAYPINDGEGIMHEGHANSTIKDSKIIDNRVNAYISIYMTAGIDGLEIRGNTVLPRGPMTDTNIPAIYVRSDRTWDRHYIRNVKVVDNVTSGKIMVMGAPAEDVMVEGNRFVGADKDKALVLNKAKATVRNNPGFKEMVQDVDLPLADPDRPSARWGYKKDEK